MSKTASKLNNIRKFQKVDKPSRDFFAESSKADTSLYEPYQQRPFNPDELYQKKGNYDLFDDMKDDDQIGALFHLKKLIIIDNKWTIETDDEKAKEFLEDNLKGIHLDRKLYDMLSSLEYGFSLTEKIFEIDNNLINLKDLKTRPPHSFELRQDEFGELVDIVQYTGSGDIHLDKAKFLHMVNQQEFDNPYGKSDLNGGVYTDWWAKTNILRFWNIFLERNGMPIAHGTYPDRFVDLKDEIKKALKNLQAKTAIVTPEDVKVMLLEARGNGAAFKAAIEYYNTAIARKMLVPDLLGLAGERTSGGSYALGREQFGVFFVVVEQIRSELERIINKEIIKPLIDWNFGDQVDAEFRFLRVDDAKREKNTLAWLEWFKNGGTINQEAIEWFHQQIDAPIPEALEVEPTAQPQIRPDKVKEDIEEEQLKRTFIDEDKAVKEFDSLESKHERALKPILKTGIEQALERATKIVERKNFKALKTFDPLTNKRALRNALKAMIKDGFKAGKESLKQHEIKFTLEEDKLAQWIDEHAEFILTTESFEIAKQARPIISEGIRNGLGTKEIVRQLKSKLSGITKARLDTLARTTINRAFNQARAQGFVSLGDRVKGYEYQAILDDRTSAICSELDGKIFKPDELGDVNPPNHFRCRSVLNPIFEGKDFDKIPSNFVKDGDFFKIKQ